MSFRIDISSDVNQGTSTSDIIQTVYPVKRTNGLKYEIALLQLNTYYSWYNVSSTLGNDVFKYYNGTTWQTGTLANGVYSFTSLVNEIQNVLMYGNGDYIAGTPPTYNINFSLDVSTQYIDITLTNSFQIDWTVSKLRTIFGMNSVVQSASQWANNMSNFTNSVDAIRVHYSDISAQTIADGSPSDILFTFDANGYVPNSSISVMPTFPQYIVRKTTSDLTDYRIWLSDQNNIPIDLAGQPPSVSLHYRVLKD